MLVLGAVAGGLGVACVVYAGPGRAVVRGHLGDVAATMLVYAALAVVLPRLRIVWRAGATAALALAIELHQLLRSAGPPRGVAGELVLGAHFDWVDLVAYAAGIATAVTWERRGGGHQRVSSGTYQTPSIR
jgi:hypothetical protein